jgi:hypothetical protein
MEGQVSTNVQTLKRHRYPIWIVIFGLLIVIALVFSLINLPGYFAASKDLRAAHNAYKIGNFGNATKLYNSALTLVPTSRVARLGAAMAIFSNTDRSNDLTALRLLVGMTLNSSEWSDITRVMPTEYKKYFQETKQ